MFDYESLWCKSSAIIDLHSLLAYPFSQSWKAFRRMTLNRSTSFWQLTPTSNSSNCVMDKQNLLSQLRNVNRQNNFPKFWSLELIFEIETRCSGGRLQLPRRGVWIYGRRSCRGISILFLVNVGTLILFSFYFSCRCAVSQFLCLFPGWHLWGCYLARMRYFLQHQQQHFHSKNHYLDHPQSS